MSEEENNERKCRICGGDGFTVDVDVAENEEGELYQYQVQVRCICTYSR